MSSTTCTRIQKRCCHSWLWLLICITSSTTSDAATTTLKLVHVIYRHGDRTPTASFPTNVYQENHWPQGFKQLTLKGVQQSFELGQFLRKRYDGFLHKNYLRKQIYARSSDVDRTIQSALSVLSGLYPPPTGVDRHNNQLPWLQPIPVHTAPYFNDPLLKVSKYNCPRYVQHQQQVTKRQLDKLDNENKKFLKYLREHSGLSDLSCKKIGHLYSPLFVQAEHHLGWPGWVNATIWTHLRELKRVVRLMKFDDVIEAQLRGGFLLGDIVKRMRRKVGATLDNPELKMQMYSTHDSTLLALLFALKVANGLLPPYSSCLMVELHHNSSAMSFDLNDNYFVKIYFRNDTHREPYELEVPGCPPAACTLPLIEKMLSDTLIASQEELDDVCGNLQHHCAEQRREDVHAHTLKYESLVEYIDSISIT